jgi:hypothetical protein
MAAPTKTLTPAQRRTKIAKERAQIAAKKKADAANPHPAQDKLTLAELQKQYGWVKALIDTDAELLKLFNDATKGGWTADHFQARLRSTQWYQHHQESLRNAEIMRTTDPASWTAANYKRQSEITSLAAQQGATLSAADLKYLAWFSLQQGWDINSAQMQAHVGAYINEAQLMNPTNETTAVGGTVAKAYNDIKKLASDYLIPYSDQSAADWAVRIAKGTSTPEAAQQYFVSQAKTHYGFMAAALDGGQTVRDYLEPYRQQAATTLGIVPDTIDWKDAKWQSIFSATDQTGKSVPLTLAQSTQKIKTDPLYGYDQSQPGKEERSGFAHQMLNMFGFNPGSG